METIIPLLLLRKFRLRWELTSSEGSHNLRLGFKSKCQQNLVHVMTSGGCDEFSRAQKGRLGTEAEAGLAPLQSCRLIASGARVWLKGWVWTQKLSLC